MSDISELDILKVLECCRCGKSIYSHITYNIMQEAKKGWKVNNEGLVFCPYCVNKMVENIEQVIEEKKEEENGREN